MKVAPLPCKQLGLFVPLEDHAKYGGLSPVQTSQFSCIEANPFHWVYKEIDI